MSARNFKRTNLLKTSLVTAAAMLTAIVLAIISLIVSDPTKSSLAQTSTDTRPNIVFVMTDDMPPNLLTRMPHVRDRIKAQGLTLSNAYVSQSLCCPSRATILRGQY
jgi:N-acetylglucosamine-6-sulfatase